MIKACSILFGLIAAFFFLPSEFISSQYKIICPMDPQESINKWNSVPKPKLGEHVIDLDSINIFGGDIKEKSYERRLKEWESRPLQSLKEIVISKSGLRRAIEGRLNWLGFSYDLDFLNQICDLRRVDYPPDL